MSSSRTAMLVRYFDFDSLWTGAIRPWVLEHSVPGVKAGMSAIMVPTLRTASLLRARLVGEGLSHFGIHFATHVDMWNRLRAHLGIDRPVAAREDLHLALAASARGSRVQNPSVRSVSRDPSSLMRAMDHLTAAGWAPQQVLDAEIKPVIAAFDQALHHSNMLTAQEIDSRLLREAGGRPPLCSSLLVIGFSGRHWPLWFFLQAAVRSSREAVVCLREPRIAANPAEETWIGSWENMFGEAATVPPAKAQSAFTALSDAISSRTVCTGARVRLRIAKDASTEALAVATQVIAYLSESPAPPRIGVIFPPSDPAARQTSAMLASAGIEFNDAMGMQSNSLSQTRWSLWLEFHANPDIPRLVSLLEKAPELARGRAACPDDLLRKLLQIFDDMAVTDLRMVKAKTGLDISATLGVLPEEATFEVFAGAVARWFDNLPELAEDGVRERFFERRAGFGPEWDAVISREIFVRWLSESLPGVKRTRYPEASHPFARVQLLPYDDAETGSFSHLILAGLNRHRWPPDFRPEPFLPTQTLDGLNRIAATEGRHGAGHRATKTGFGLIPGPAERAAMAQQQFYSLVECPSEEICLSASLTSVDDPSRSSSPCDLLIRTWLAATGETLSDCSMAGLSQQTDEWLGRSNAPALLSSRSLPDPDLPPPESTRAAYEARRDESRPFGIHEFSLAAGRKHNVVLSCTAWETAVSAPEIVWLRCYLGAEARQDPFLDVESRRLVGIWTHAWLRQALAPHDRRTCGPAAMPDRSTIADRLRGIAAERLRAARLLFEKAGGAPPFWWLRLHEQTLSGAESMASHAAELIESGFRLGMTEWRLPDGTRVKSDACDLPVTGRIDLALYTENDRKCMVIDFKTGAPPTLTPATVSDGTGLQILLYSLSMAEDAPISMAVVHPAAAPRIRSADELAADESVAAVLSMLSRMHETGVFGGMGDPREEFKRSHDYPLAHLRVNPDILAVKRRLTFARTDESP